MRPRQLLAPAAVAVGSLAAASALVVAWSELVHLRASTRGLGRPPRAVGREAVVVLGFGNRGPHANRINRYRVRAGLRSRDRRATSSVLILCGGSVMGDEPEAAILARHARDDLGYTGPLLLEDTSRSTWENIENAIPLLEDADTIRIVSDSVHAEAARGFLRAQRPDLADRLARADEYRFGEMAWMKPLAVVVAWLSRRKRRRPDGRATG